MKKFLKITGIVLGILLLILFLAPIVFERQLKDLVRKTINERVDAEVAFSDIDLSLLRNFPDASLGIEELVIINKAPFAGDTLAYSKEIRLEMSVRELFKGSGEAMKIDALALDQSYINILIDSLGNNNYDIALEKPSTTADTTSGGFSFDVEHYEFHESKVQYRDIGAGIHLLVSELEHEGTGDFSAEVSELSTSSSAMVSYTQDSINYLDRNKVQLEADFEMNLETMRFTFLENQAMINQLPLTFEGFVQVNEENNEVDLAFKTPTSSFKNFLAVMPETYSKNIEQVETQGDFVVQGQLKGIIDEVHIPKMNIQISSQNASFKYSELPKAVEDINIDVVVVNQTGIAADTYVQIDTLNFRIDQDPFRARGSLKNITENILVDMDLDGTINLANIEKAYPLELEQDLNGVVAVDLSTRFDMNSVESEQYQNIQSSGTATIRDFRYTSPEMANELVLSTAVLQFNSGSVMVKNFNATTGQTDLKLEGTLQNLMGYFLKDQELKGQFTARSNTFSVNDFMVKEPVTEPTNQEVSAATTNEAVKIPSFLDISLDFRAEKVLYDNLELRNAVGVLDIQDQTAHLREVSADLFEGKIGLNGTVSTKGATPDFNMKLGLQSIDIAQAFSDMELLQNLAPIAQALQGTLSTDIDLHGNLNNNLSPQLQSLAGSAMAQIIGAQVIPEQTALLQQLDQQLEFIDLKNLDLNDLETHLKFDNGQVQVQPFDFTVKGIRGTVSGTHGFDLQMNYNLTLDIPARYLGDQLGGTLSRLTASQQEDLMVALPVGLTGTFQDPRIQLNMEQAVQNLSQQILSSQKDNLKQKGREVLSDILSRGTTKDSVAPPKQDSTATKEDAVKETAKEIFGGILRGNKKKKDTTQQK